MKRSLFLCALAFVLATTPAAASAQSCDVINANWEDYGEQIEGANTKVSNVVLNACEAIGGRDACAFTSGARTPTQNEDVNGASNSQHLIENGRNAIDLEVLASGRDKDFLTYAICGLERVNDCQGGLGYYSSGAIHVDVRTGTAVWSDDYTGASVQNISDEGTQSLLTDFGGGKCTGGIVGEYGESDSYGPPVQFTPPDDLKDYIKSTDGEVGHGLYEQALIQALTQSTAGQAFSPTYAPGSVQGGTAAFTPSGSTYRSFTPVSSSGSNTENDSSLLSFDVFNRDDDTDSSSQPSVGGSREVDCEGTGLFGTNWFSTCRESPTSEQGSSTADGPSEAPTGSPGTTTSGDASGSGAVRDSSVSKIGDRSLAGTIRDKIGSIGRATEVFYGVHTPEDGIESSEGRQRLGSDFVAGETRAPREPQRDGTRRAIEQSARAAALTTRESAYYGLVHGFSPSILGGLPRALWRMAF